MKKNDIKCPSYYIYIQEMPDYTKGKIYTIRCYEDKSLIYVGSTTKALCDRKSNHKFESTRQLENIFYKTVKHNGGWDNWYIELVENHPCNSKAELEKREGEIMREIGNLNQKYREDYKKKKILNIKMSINKL
jgi:hypothetical protein